MLTQDNLADLLHALGFEKKGGIPRKTIDAAVLEVNFTKKEITYPENAGMVINQRQTCDFKANENFVVLECVHRLLWKGYKPEHIELEPKWKLGRGASGGRADVLIRDNDGRPLLIIECKTAGTTFKLGWNKTLQDGDQLFNYAQQISETRFLCLYISDLDAGALTYASHILSRGRFTHRLSNDPKFFGGQYPFIKTGDVIKAKGGKVSYSQTLNDLGLSVSRVFEPPVVLINIAANIGDVALLDYPACFTDSVVGLMPIEEVIPRFPELMMRNQKNHLNEIVPKLAQKNINLEILKPLKNPIPPLSEQKKFVEKIEQLEKKVADAQAVIESTAVCKQAILQKYL